MTLSKDASISMSSRCDDVAASPVSVQPDKISDVAAAGRVSAFWRDVVEWGQKEQVDCAPHSHVDVGFFGLIVARKLFHCRLSHYVQATNGED